MLKSFQMSSVKLTDSYLTNAFDKELRYLTSLDCDKLLSCFRKTRGLEPKKENYGGWESTEIRGHTLGHYMTALSQGYAATKNSSLYDRLHYIIDELSLCQFDSGYLSAFPQEFFDKLENRKPIWVPWYTIHKIMSGLISVYKLAGITDALDVASKLGNWVYERTNKWTPEIRKNVLSVEYGGMNDCMYELFKITKNRKYADAAHIFDETELFEEIYNGNDILDNRHANTTIPKFLGALNRYLALGKTESFYLESCKRFWDIVVHSHSYVTGGNSESEHFGKPNILDAERTELNCETCNTYNMLKMSKALFMITGDKKYADFYERTFFNAILSSQNSDTGMTMYFQPMATGYFKVFNRPFSDFWCCTGTGMENFTKLNNGLYFFDADKLFVNLYISSSVRWPEKKTVLEQNTEIPNNDTAEFTVHTQENIKFSLCLRIPDWAKSAKIKINGRDVSVNSEGGYAVLCRVWTDNDTVSIQFGIEACLCALPDNKNAVAFTFGPLVLSAALGEKKLDESNTGIMVRIPSKHVEIKDYIVIKGKSVEEWKRTVKDNLIRTDGKLEFRLSGTDEDARLLFTPHFSKHHERYGIYWTLVEDGSPELEKYLAEKRCAVTNKAALIDAIQIGNDQYELSHNIKGCKTESGDREGYHYRVAKPEGFFSYDLKTNGAADTYLEISYISGNCKDGFDIYINDSLFLHEKPGDIPWNHMVSKAYRIPTKLYGGKNDLTVKFAASAKNETARIVNNLKTLRTYCK